MIRVIAENVMLFLMPTIVWVLYTYVKRRRENLGFYEVLSMAPAAWLFATGAILVVCVLVFFGSTSGGRPGQIYEPATMQNGTIVPGRMR